MNRQEQRMALWCDMYMLRTADTFPVRMSQACKALSDFDKIFGKSAPAALTPPENNKVEYTDEDYKNCPDLLECMPFGKHKNKEIGEVAAHHPEYLDWVLANLDESHITKSIDKVVEYLEEGPDPKPYDPADEVPF